MFALQPELKVFSGSANRELADRICKYVGVPLGQATISSFPDGETYVRIEENIRGHDVFIIQPTSPPTNEHLMELLIMVDAARRASADRITAVIPLFRYPGGSPLFAAGLDQVFTKATYGQNNCGFSRSRGAEDGVGLCGSPRRESGNRGEGTQKRDGD